jgi:hypothetical protein
MRAKKILLQLLGCAALAGCAHPTDPFRHAFREPVARVGDFFPPPTHVRLQWADANQVTYEYSRMAGNGLPDAIEAAERGCAPEGKRAHIVTLGVRSFERGWATFQCL